MVDVSFHVEDHRALADENKSNFVAISQFYYFDVETCYIYMHLKHIITLLHYVTSEVI